MMMPVEQKEDGVQDLKPWRCSSCGRRDGKAYARNKFGGTFDILGSRQLVVLDEYRLREGVSTAVS
jgi:hypothetical protein